MQGITFEDSNLQTFVDLYVLLYAADNSHSGVKETDLQDAVDATLFSCRNFMCINISKTKQKIL